MGYTDGDADEWGIEQETEAYDVNGSRIETKKKMIRKESIMSVCDSVGITTTALGHGGGGLNMISGAALDKLSKHVTLRIKQVIGDAVKFMRHSNRDLLTIQDINDSLAISNVESSYGYVNPDGLQYKQIMGENEALFYVTDPILSFEQVLQQPLPKCPAEPTFSVHWLSVEGIQPRIPQNPQTEQANDTAGASGTSLTSQQKSLTTAPHTINPQTGIVFNDADTGRPLVRHKLSIEQQKYYEHITLAIRGQDQVLLGAALKSLSTEDGLQQLLPYFIQFISQHTTLYIYNLPILQSLIYMIHALLVNKYVYIEPYLHQLMPYILTCLVGQKLSDDPSSDHWSLRDYSATLLHTVCTLYSPTYTHLQPRITALLCKTFLDMGHSLTTHYGAIRGLQKLGHNVVSVLLIPNIESYLKLLQPVLLDTRNPVKRMEAHRVYGVLIEVVGEYIRHELETEYEQYHSVLVQTEEEYDDSDDEGDDDVPMDDDAKSSSNKNTDSRNNKKNKRRREDNSNDNNNRDTHNPNATSSTSSNNTDTDIHMSDSNPNHTAKSNHADPSNTTNNNDTNHINTNNDNPKENTASTLPPFSHPTSAVATTLSLPHIQSLYQIFGESLTPYIHTHVHIPYRYHAMMGYTNNLYDTQTGTSNSNSSRRSRGDIGGCNGYYDLSQVFL